MCITQHVLVLVGLSVGLAQSLSWDFVVTTDRTLDFYEGSTLTHSEDFEFGIKHLTYDAVQNRLLFLDEEKTRNIFLHSLNLATMERQSFFMKKSDNIDYNIHSLAYDPATELVYYSDSQEISWFSLKPGFKNDFSGNHLIESGFANDEFFYAIAIDSCRGYIYWVFKNGLVTGLKNARLDGSHIATLQVSHPGGHDHLVIDQQTQKLLFTDEYTYGRIERSGRFVINSIDLNTQLSSSQHSELYKGYPRSKALTVSKDYIYWMDYIDTVWKLPKYENAKSVKIPTNSFGGAHTLNSIVANYKIEDQIRGTEHCDMLKSKISVFNNNSHNVPTNESLVCQNYCIQGNCRVSEGQAICSCIAGYSGDRCEVNICQGYCLNGGDCYLNEKSEPLCQCKGDYRGDRCAVSVLVMKCFQTISMLKDIINTDVIPFALDYGEKSTCTK